MVALKVEASIIEGNWSVQWTETDLRKKEFGVLGFVFCFYFPVTMKTFIVQYLLQLDPNAVPLDSVAQLLSQMSSMINNLVITAMEICPHSETG